MSLLGIGRRVLNRALERFGVELSRLPDADRFHVDAFRDQRRLLSSALTIFDVGAHIGQTAKVYRALFPESRIYSFEPGQEAFAKLEHACHSLSNVVPINCALGERSGERLYYRNAFDATNSLLPTSAAATHYTDVAWLERAGTALVPTTTLDDYCERHRIGHIGILKMDVQGGEMMALQGGECMVADGRIDLVYSEVLFAPLYEGQATFQEVHAHLERRGFVLYGLYDMQYGINPRGELAWCDALFCRRELIASGGE